MNRAIMRKTLWEIYSLFYNLALSIFLPYQSMMEDLIDSLDIRKEDKILDAGCGPAFLIRKMAEKHRGEKLRIIGVDFSQRMISYAQKRCADIPGISFKLVDLNDDLDFPENYFEKIGCSNTLYALNNPQRTIEQFYRILSHRGYLVISNPKLSFDLGKLTREHIETLAGLRPVRRKVYHLFVLFRTLPMYFAIITISKVIVERAEKGEYHFLDKEELEEIYEKVGFKNIRISSTYADQDWLIRGEK